jgi:hypothetical protein
MPSGNIGIHPQRLPSDLDPPVSRERHQRDRHIVIGVQPQCGGILQCNQHRFLHLSLIREECE